MTSLCHSVKRLDTFAYYEVSRVRQGLNSLKFVHLLIFALKTLLTETFFSVDHYMKHMGLLLGNFPAD